MFLSLLFSTQNSIAQKNCATDDYSDVESATTLPWYGNNTYLNSYMDSLQTVWQQEAGRSATPTSYTIPIQFIVLLAVGETLDGAVPPDRFARLITALNQGYQSNGIPFNFTMLCVKTVQPTSTTVSFLGANAHLDANRTNGAVNVLIAKQFTGIFENQNFFTPVGDGICLLRTIGISAYSAEVFPHEMGHFFGLKHTHLGHAAPYDLPICNQEQVKRGFIVLPYWCSFKALVLGCSITGDFLCDTEADQGPTKAAAGVTTDFFGDTYHPDRSNYMSYYGLSSPSKFTTQQKAVIMNRFGKRLFIANIYKNKLNVDKYENDDFDATAKKIAVSETQIHTMYSAENCLSDLKDIVYFQITPSLGSYYVNIANITGDIVGEVNVFKGIKTNNEIKRNGNFLGIIISDDGKNIEIPCNAAQLGYCIIEINKKIDPPNTTNTFGEYSIALLQSYQPNITPKVAEVCIGTKFSINGLSPNGKIQWYSSATLSNNKLQTTQIIGNPTSDNNAWITATVEENGCSVDLPYLDFKLNDMLPDPMIKNVTSYGVYNNCKSFKYKFKANITGATYVDWKTTCGPSSGCGMTKISDTEIEVSGDFISWDGNKGTYIEVTVVATNACGVSVSYTYKTSFSRGSCLGTDGGGRDNIELAPNPTKTTTTIKMIPKDEVGNEGVVRFIQIVNPVNGVQYEQKTDATEIELDVTGFMDGIYYVLVSRDGETSQAVLVVQKE